MKKYLIAALALLCMGGNAMALENEPESGFTCQALVGMSVTKINGLGKFDGLGDYSGKVGGNFGFKVEYMLPNAHGTFINAGLNWKMKGAKRTYDLPCYETFGDATSAFHTVSTDNKIKLNYIELPIHVGFHYNFSDEVGVYGEVGPYFAMGICGKSKISLDADGSWVEQYESSYAAFRNSNDVSKPSFQRWDMGIGFRIGCEYNKHYSLNIGCDWGLTDMYRDGLRDAYYDTYKSSLDKAHNFNLDITFGYRF